MRHSETSAPNPLAPTADIVYWSREFARLASSKNTDKNKNSFMDSAANWIGEKHFWLGVAATLFLISVFLTGPTDVKATDNTSCYSSCNWKPTSFSDSSVEYVTAIGDEPKTQSELRLKYLDDGEKIVDDDGNYVGHAQAIYPVNRSSGSTSSAKCVPGNGNYTQCVADSNRAIVDAHDVLR
jgi:hypothetical protein